MRSGEKREREGGGGSGEHGEESQVNRLHKESRLWGQKTGATEETKRRWHIPEESRFERETWAPWEGRMVKS